MSETEKPNEDEQELAAEASEGETEDAAETSETSDAAPVSDAPSEAGESVEADETDGADESAVSEDPEAAETAKAAGSEDAQTAGDESEQSAEISEAVEASEEEQPAEDDEPPREETRPIKQIVEGAILAAEQPLSVDQLMMLFELDQPERSAIKDALKEIEEDCADRGFELKQVASGYRFQVKVEYGEWVSRLWREKPPRYTRALLETLALIAYKQPITRGDIEEIRGVAVSTNIMRTLIERDWVRVVGHRDVPGHPALYATTRQFLDYFNLKSLDQLPTLAEIRDLSKVSEELDMEEELIEVRTLEIDTEDQEVVEGIGDEDLDAVTDQVNSIQENIKNMFKEPEPEPDFDDDDEVDAAAEFSEPTNTPSEDAVNDNDTEETHNETTESTEKLQKVLAAKGLGSRREIERWIADGRVNVNGKTATLGDRVTPEDRIKVDGRPVSTKPQSHRHLLYNKPEGEICSRDDPEGRKTVFDRLPRLKNQRWISVGRLDYNTSGLLLFTTDGELANRLMHPSSNIEREYAVRVLGNVSDEALQNMKEGVLLEDGIYRFTDIQQAPDAEDHDDKANQWFYVVLMEGKNREVRRLWESQGYTVSRLKRVRYGNFFIPSAVKAGRFIDLKHKDRKILYEMAGLEER